MCRPIRRIKHKKLETPGQPYRAFLSRRSRFGSPKKGSRRMNHPPSAAEELFLLFLLGDLLDGLLGNLFHFLLGHLTSSLLETGERTRYSGLGPRSAGSFATETRQRTLATSCPRRSERRNRSSFVSAWLFLLQQGTKNKSKTTTRLTTI
jgi:hypothetical protein